MRGRKPAANRVEMHQIPIQDLSRERRYDVIVSGLPLNNFSAELVERIFDTFTCLLKPGGTLSFFEYIAVRRIKALVSRCDERRRLRQIDGILSSMLDTHEIRRECIVANVLPAWVHHAKLS